MFSRHVCFRYETTSGSIGVSTRRMLDPENVVIATGISFLARAEAEIGMGVIWRILGDLGGGQEWHRWIRGNE